MNRGINLFVFLMSCVILSVSVMIGFKAHHDLEDTTKYTKTETKSKTIETPSEVNLTKVNSNNTLPDDSAKVKSNPKPKVIPITDINKQARIDQQKLYMVIAGGFQDEINAQNHQLQLKELGYNAEVVRFKNSRLHVVCAGKFREPSKANHLVTTLLQAHQIEAYVQVPI